MGKIWLILRKDTGKIGKIKRDYGINLNTIINKNLEIDDTDLDGEKVMMNPWIKVNTLWWMKLEVEYGKFISEPINVRRIIDTLRSEYEVWWRNLQGYSSRIFRKIK